MGGWRLDLKSGPVSYKREGKMVSMVSIVSVVAGR